MSGHDIKDSDKEPTMIVVDENDRSYELTQEQQNDLLREFSRRFGCADAAKAAVMCEKSDSSDVVIGDFPTTLDIPVDRVLNGCADWKEVLIIGTDEAGNSAAASSIGDHERILWLASRFVHRLLAGDNT